MLKYLLGAIAVAVAGYAVAQVYPGQPNPVALVCAYNTSPAAPVAGQFYYVQCDINGKIIVQ